MFCDLVGSVSISERLDSEELRELIRGYHESCGTVIHRFDGHIAQYLGDGILVYFGYPVAREDDAVRAVRAGLEIIAAVESLNRRIRHPLDLRVGINTGQVVVGEIGKGERREELALGSTPNIAARIQACAKPNTLLIGEGTYFIVKGFFECTDLGPIALTGLRTTVRLFQVTGLSSARRRYDIVAREGLTPMVGRADEVVLLERLWRESRDARGQVVLVRGEAGIGKTRLVEVVRHRAKEQDAICNVFRCSPEHRNAAFHPVIDFLQRLLRFDDCKSSDEKFARLETSLREYQFYDLEVLSLMAALLSLPVRAGCPSLTASPAMQRRRTLDSLVAWLCEEALKQPLLSIWEDLRWADPSTLELLGILIDRLSTIPTLALFTFRPTFVPTWSRYPHVTQIDVPRLSNGEVESMLRGLFKAHELPAVAVDHIISKTDGVPLFVEELTKMLLETGALRETSDGYEVARELADTNVPSTLQDSLMARLDRLE